MTLDSQNTAYIPRRVLITGGCGFIGSNFIHYLFSLNNKIEIINYDLLTYAGNKKNLEEFEFLDDYSFVKGDIRDKESLSLVFQKFKPDTVINFAAESHVDRSIKDPNVFLETNIIGTNNLAILSLEFGVGRFVQISTDEVYGDLTDEESPFTESSMIKPSSPYASSKASADLLILSFCRTFGLPAIVTRCSNNYGPYQHIEKLIPKIINNSINGEKIPIYGTGNNIRDWIHVLDHCKGIFSAMTNGALGQVYNFGGNCEIRNINIVKRILSYLDISENLIEFVEDRLGHDYRYAVDSSKSLKDLNWRPNISFEEGINETIKWYQSNEDWIIRLGD
tara:strand:- start:288 stop:1295 length:1008 start_codon:yes stop_codon:yes gene_type:complete